ncbi:ferrous iron transport protein B [Moorellaceae bacterium AZ2]
MSAGFPSGTEVLSFGPGPDCPCGRSRRARTEPRPIVVALAGNPNIGKTTVFNALTGLRQHTGNWAGKTVGLFWGSFCYRGAQFLVVDLPGTYSLRPLSPEEEVTRDFLLKGQPQVTVVVVDATALERSLALALQIMELSRTVVLCVNLTDEAQKRGLEVDTQTLTRELGIPVVATAARRGEGLAELEEAIYRAAHGKREVKPRTLRYDEEIESMVEEIVPLLSGAQGDVSKARWQAIRLLEGEQIAETGKEVEELVDRLRGERAGELSERIICRSYQVAEEVAEKAVKRARPVAFDRDRWLDNLLTSSWTGFPVMLLLLGVLFWITLVGANYPSEMLAGLFSGAEKRLVALSQQWSIPVWLRGLVIEGVYRTTTWVVSVMLPPMAIFFPLFTFLEDLGYLPRVAFNLDGLFKWAGTQGKQALTMSMGFGCNAAGVIACRIIDSPRERLIAMLTNVSTPKLQPDLCRVTTLLHYVIRPPQWGEGGCLKHRRKGCGSAQVPDYGITYYK